MCIELKNPEKAPAKNRFPTRMILLKNLNGQNTLISVIEISYNQIRMNER